MIIKQVHSQQLLEYTLFTNINNIVARATSIAEGGLLFKNIFHKKSCETDHVRLEEQMSKVLIILDMIQIPNQSKWPNHI